MLRLLSLILLFVLYAPKVDSAIPSCVKPSVAIESCVYESVVDGDDNLSYNVRFSSDLLQGQVLARPISQRTLLENNGGTSTPSVLRHNRVNSTLRALSSAVPCRHAGRITKIFEYNHFRSVLRVVYYLHTLCRLRI
ncbi:MAG: hypothetical protein IKY82_04800 [Alistipes sp.]|nr:hypothetical protein [Alistipes sp.]